VSPLAPADPVAPVSPFNPGINGDMIVIIPPDNVYSVNLSLLYTKN
jgi:hypothetical protein